MLLLLPLLLLCGCAAPDPAVAYYEELHFGWRSPDEAALMQTGQAYRRDSDGTLLYIAAPFPDEPPRVFVYSRPDALPRCSAPPFQVEITGFSPHSVCYTLTGTGTTPDTLSLYCTLDVQINGQWYFLWDPTQEHDCIPSGDGWIAYGKAHIGNTSWLDPIRPGHYRLCLTHDPAEGWVMAEFDVTEEALMEVRQE